jgi:hypothetical protein
VDWSTVTAGLLGAVLGALFTVGGTWWVSVRLDRQRANRELVNAIGIVSTELEENRRRISDGGDAETLRHRLTLGDWAGSKAAFVGLAVRREELWAGVVNVYRVIYEFRSGWRDDYPDADQLSGLVMELREVQRELGRELGTFVRLMPGRSGD